jgi:hypothetical protein
MFSHELAPFASFGANRLVQIIYVVPNHNVCIKDFAIETRVIDAENLGFSVTFLVQLEVQ